MSEIKQTPKQKFDALRETSNALESTLASLNGVNIMELEERSALLPQMVKSIALDYDAVKEVADEQADSSLESIVLMYLPREFIISQRYIMEKMKVDKKVLSSLLFQVVTGEHAIKRLMEQVDEGQVRDNTFMVLSSLQRSVIEILKHVSSYMIVMENNYRDLRKDYLREDTVTTKELGTARPQDPETPVVTEEPEEVISTKFRGTKDIMSLIKNAGKEAKEVPEE